eukprot:TRINITY_DN11609_c0_g1_i1.p1 TRINITY_DN11609_c0_g1~~TRINITY_DN11609_c0_g1_i1.p1  ORF type:complete len:216 (+),score=47.82 TRINITY_DN11609_c0_g1_i1:48-695(+)
MLVHVPTTIMFETYSLKLKCFFFFFKQKTAYEMLRSLVGSEMCIRDRVEGNPLAAIGKFKFIAEYSLRQEQTDNRVRTQELTEYEQQRQHQIRRNQGKLLELGLTTTPPQPQPPAKTATPLDNAEGEGEGEGETTLLEVPAPAPQPVLAPGLDPAAIVPQPEARQKFAVKNMKFQVRIEVESLILKYGFQWQFLQLHNVKSVSYTHLTLPTKRIV